MVLEELPQFYLLMKVQTIIAIDKDKIALKKLKLKLKKNCVLKNINCTDIDDINQNLNDIKMLMV